MEGRVFDSSKGVENHQHRKIVCVQFDVFHLVNDMSYAFTVAFVLVILCLQRQLTILTAKLIVANLVQVFAGFFLTWEIDYLEPCI